MRRKASGGVSTPEKSTPRRSTRGRVRRSPSKTPEPEPDTDDREYGASASTQDEEKNSSSEEETTSRKGGARARGGRGRSTSSRRKTEEATPSRTRRNSRREKETQEELPPEPAQVEENGAENKMEQVVDQPDAVDTVTTEEVMEPIPEETAEELQSSDTVEQNFVQDEQDGSETTASARHDDREHEERNESPLAKAEDSEPETKASEATVEKVSHTNGDEEEKEEEETDNGNDKPKINEPEDARDDSKTVVNNRSRTRQESDSNESGPEEAQRDPGAAKRNEREAPELERVATVEESMDADAATSGTEEEAKVTDPCDKQHHDDRHDAAETDRPKKDSFTAPDPSEGNVTHVAPPSKEYQKEEDELEAGEIKDTDQSMSEPNNKEEVVVQEAPRIRPLQRKRRWLSSKNADNKPAVITISTDSLKNIISDVKPVPLADVKLESSSEPEGADEAASADENEKDRARRKLRESNDSFTQLQQQALPQRRRLSKSAEKENIAIEGADGDTNGDASVVLAGKPKLATEKIALSRKISIVSDDGSTVGTTAPVVRPPSPAKHLTSNILFITNLVRPFTVLQLKGLLARTGKIVENGFWIDKIKSKCYVKYETEDESTETRHALHGIRWPVSNPKCLVVDFGSEEAMEKAILSTLEDGALRASVEGAKEGKEFGWSRDASKKEETVRRVREWDLGKKDAFEQERDGRGGRDREREGAGLADKDKGADRTGRDRERGRETEDGQRDGRGNRPDGAPGDRSLERKRSAEREFGRERRRSTSVSPARKFKKKENEPPIRLLDDLFRKTKTTPCIYWLPLTTEQIAVKEEQRRKNMAEHQRRVEEQRKQEEERERERKRERERRDRERERERERDRERDRDRDRDRDRRRSRSRERSRDDGGRRRHR